MSPARASSDASRERVATELTGPLADLGLDLEAVELTPAGARRLLRIAVDKDGGVTDADLVEASRVASECLDASSAMGERPYTLELTSRGVDRPLTLPRHWRRNHGRLVRVTTTDEVVVTGRVTGSDDEAVTLVVAGQQRTIALADVRKAVVQIEFNPRRDEEGI